MDICDGDKRIPMKILQKWKENDQEEGPKLDGYTK